MTCYIIPYFNRLSSLVSEVNGKISLPDFYHNFRAILCASNLDPFT